jgi:hypothetical protein
MKIIFIFLFIFTSWIYPQNSYLYLNGNGAYVGLPSVIINSSEFTIEAWAKTLGSGGGIENQNILFEQREDSTGDGHSTIILLTERTASIRDTRFGVRSADRPMKVVESNFNEYGDWHHYAGVVSSKGILLYIDGDLVDSTSNDQTGNYSSSIDYVDIGRHQHNSMSFGFFNGYIDEMKIWNIGKTQDEIISDMYSGQNEYNENILAYWAFDDGTATDITQNGNNGTLLNGAIIIQGTYIELCSLMGDTNNDNAVNILDILIVIDLILNENTNPFNNFCADLDNNNSINMLDILNILDSIF